MPLAFSDLVRIAGAALLIAAIWGISVAGTYWDTHRRDLPGRAAFGWLAMVTLLPIAGFILYIFFRAVGLLFHWKSRRKDSRPGETALKGTRSKHTSMPTLLASDLALQTIVNLALAAQMEAGQDRIQQTYRLTVTAGPDQGKEYVIRNLPALIGRGFEAAVGLDDDLGVSRQHAEIYEQDGILRIRDLKSTHGTQVDETLVEDAGLEMGSRIQVGLSVLVISLVED